jgi:hypothetical protein
MYNEGGDLQQGYGNGEEEDLPTYNDLEEQERSNPNTRCVGTRSASPSSKIRLQIWKMA